MEGKATLVEASTVKVAPGVLVKVKRTAVGQAEQALQAGRTAGRLGFKRADVHARAGRARQAALVGAGEGVVARVERGAAGQEMTGERGTAVRGQRAEFGIQVQHVAGGGKAGAAVGHTDEVVAERDEGTADIRYAVGGDVAGDDAVQELHAATLVPNAAAAAGCAGSAKRR